MNAFTHGLLPSLTTPEAPEMAVISTPRPVNKTMMPRQKTIACNTPSRLPPDWRFKKNETVNGIMGKTQGVKMAASPAPNAIRKKPRPEDCCTGAGEAVVGVIGVDAAGVATNV